MPGPAADAKECLLHHGKGADGMGCVCALRERGESVPRREEGQNNFRGGEGEGRSSWKGGRRGGRNEMENCSSFSEKPFERALLAASSSFASMIWLGCFIEIKCVINHGMSRPVGPLALDQEAMQLHTGYATLPKKGNVGLTAPAVPKSKTGLTLNGQNRM